MNQKVANHKKLRGGIKFVDAVPKVSGGIPDLPPSHPLTAMAECQWQAAAAATERGRKERVPAAGGPEAEGQAVRRRIGWMKRRLYHVPDIQAVFARQRDDVASISNALPH